MAATTYRNSSLIGDDDSPPPPEYSVLPRPEEKSLDAGAGAPIVRTQPRNRIINPSDPRSRYARQYRAGQSTSQTHPPPELPRRSNIRNVPASGPVPMSSPRLPPRRHHQPHNNNINHSRQSSTSPPTPRLPSRTSSPSSTRLHQHPHHASPATTEGISSGYRNAQPQIIRNEMMSMPGAYPNSQSSMAAHATCPNCRNTGWMRPRIPCLCPVGKAMIKSKARKYEKSLNRILDELMEPLPPTSESARPLHSSGASSNFAPPGRGTRGRDNSGGHSYSNAAYLQYVPGSGMPCPKCIGQSYFRNRQAQGTPAAREIGQWFNGSLPPHCSFCDDRGRVMPTSSSNL